MIGVWSMIRMIPDDPDVTGSYWHTFLKPQLLHVATVMVTRSHLLRVRCLWERQPLAAGFTAAIDAGASGARQHYQLQFDHQRARGFRERPVWLNRWHSETHIRLPIQWTSHIFSVYFINKVVCNWNEASLRQFRPLWSLISRNAAGGRTLCKHFKSSDILSRFHHGWRATLSSVHVTRAVVGLKHFGF